MEVRGPQLVTGVRGEYRHSMHAGAVRAGFELDVCGVLWGARVQHEGASGVVCMGVIGDGGVAASPSLSLTRRL